MDHAPQEQSTGAPAPSVDERLSALTQSLVSESQDDPNAWGEEKEEPAEEAEEPSEPTEEAEEPAAEATEPQEELEEVEYADGKKFQVPKELKRGWLREDDYTRKTQKLAEKDRAVEGTLQALQTQAQVLQAAAPYVGQLASIDAQLNELRAYMTPDLRQRDPVEFGALGTQFQLLVQQRGELAQYLSAAQGQFVQELEKTRQQTNRQRMESEMPILEATVKDFNPEKHGREVSDYLKKSGLSQEAQGFINHSPAALALVWKAKAYDQLQADKKVAQKKVEKLPPVAKTGQRVSQAEGDTDLKKLRDLNRKTGGNNPDVRRALLKAQLFGSNK